MSYTIKEGDMFRTGADRYLVAVEKCFYRGKPHWECFLLDTQEMVMLNEGFIANNWTKVA